MSETERMYSCEHNITPITVEGCIADLARTCDAGEMRMVGILVATLRLEFMAGADNVVRGRVGAMTDGDILDLCAAISGAVNEGEGFGKPRRVALLRALGVAP